MDAEKKPDKSGLVLCIHYGDCSYPVLDCEEDEPWCKCKYRELPQPQEDEE